MDHDFWHDRWREGRIGFHEGAPNALLTRFLHRLDPGEGGRVFLPLCGKSEDLSWLHGRGYEVVGCDLSRTALDQVFARHDLTPEETDLGGITRLSAPRLTLYQGDVLALTPAILGPVDAVFDRAALVALPDEMRSGYAAHLTTLAGPARQLLITFDYDQSKMDGPPFAVSASEVATRYGATHEVTPLSSETMTGALADRSGGGLEEAWLLTPR